MEILTRAIEEYLREVADHTLEMAGQGKGTEVLGAVPGRSEAEDVEIAIDRSCQQILERSLATTGLSIEIHSEHGISRVGQAKAPDYFVGSDPFDGSGLFLRRIPSDWWSVVSVFRPDDLTPVAGGAVDVLRREMYLADGTGVTLVSLDTDARSSVHPSRKTIIDGRTVIAAYLMSPAYLSVWMERAGDFVDALVNRAPDVRVWPNGGSCIYPWLARGTVHAYVMFDEPRSEIDPGLAFAWAAGFPVFSVEKDDALAPYRFVPGKQADRVPFFVAACTEEMAQEIVKKIRRP